MQEAAKLVSDFEALKEMGVQVVETSYKNLIYGLGKRGIHSLCPVFVYAATTMSLFIKWWQFFFSQ